MRGQFIIFATGSAEETFYPGGAFRRALVEGWLNTTVSRDVRETWTRLCYQPETATEQRYTTEEDEVGAVHSHTTFT